MTSAENPNFVSDFFGASRLHFIGSWKSRYEELLSTLPPPPPLPPPPEGGERTIMHIDMDCFFASVAARNRPQLQGLPLAVSWSDNERGSAEIASANYPAREKGVRNGMWVARAKKNCPELLILPYEFEEYATTDPALDPEITLGNAWCSQRVLMTPMWTNPSVAPPDNISPVRPKDSAVSSRKCCRCLALAGVAVAASSVSAQQTSSM